LPPLNPSNQEIGSGNRNNAGRGNNPGCGGGGGCGNPPPPLPCGGDFCGRDAPRDQGGKT